MEPVKKIIITLVIIATANLMNGAAENQADLNNALLEAAQENNGLQVVTDILGRGANVNAFSPNRYRSRNTPLHYAAQNNNIEMAQLFINRGAHVNAVNWQKLTPLHIAARVGNIEMVTLLLKRGADANLTNNQGKTAKDMANSSRRQNIVKVLQEWEDEDIPVTKGAQNEDN